MYKLLLPSMPTAKELEPWIEIIDLNRHYTNFGPLVCRLEEKFASELSIEVEQIATLSSATLGLELALTAMNLPKGSKILLPAFSFVATATAIVRAGHIPIFSDIDKDKWVITTDIAKAALNKYEIDAVIPVAAFGNPYNPDDWDKFSLTNNIPVIIDAAGAYGNQSVGENIVIIYSLHATKNLSAVEGGLVAGPKNLVKLIKDLSNFGISRDMSGSLRGVGTNAKMSEYHAAVCLANHSSWKKRSARRKEVHNLYTKLIKKSPNLLLQSRPIDGVYTIESVLLPLGINVNQISDELRTYNIETRRWYYPLLPFHLPLSEYLTLDDLRVSKNISSRLIGIPFHEYLKSDDINFIVEKLESSVKKYMIY